MKKILLVVLAIGFLLGGCASPTSEGVEVREVWARPAAQGGNGATYFVIRSSASDELTGVVSDVADAVEIHESVMNGDVMEMHHMGSVPLDAGKEIKFEPGGLHIMLIGLKQDLRAGDEFEITLQFKNYEDIQLQVPVQETPSMENDHELIQ